MNSITVGQGNGELVAKRVMYLAWKASRCMGMGVLQDRPTASEAEVWAQVARGNGIADADYVFGRMVKLTVRYTSQGVQFCGGNWRLDYQSFCLKYRTPDDLLAVALAELEIAPLRVA